MEIIGFVLAVVIGISLGLIGGGGSILTVPVLIYFMSVDAVSSTAYSLFIVGSTALVGAVQSYLNKTLELKIGIVFAIPSLIAVWLTRAFLIPSIPLELGVVFGIPVSKELAIIGFFALIMIVSSVSMIRSKKDIESVKSEPGTKDYFLIVIEGLVVGTITGIVGAGGGFLIIPALVLLARIPMKMAVGTSLMIIALKSLIGFTGDLMNPEIILNWNILILFTALSIVGIFIGTRLSKIISGNSLKKGFGWFLLITGIYMLIERLSQL